MTFETLAYIHRLLAAEELRTEEAYKKARDYVEELKESRASKAALEEAKEIKDNFDRIHSKAYRALDEFENHRWR